MVYPYQDNNLTALLAQHMGPVPMQQPTVQTVAPMQGMASSLAQNPNFIGMLAGLGASLAPAGPRYDWMRSLGGTVAGMNKNKAYGDQLATAMGKPKPSGLGTLLQSPQEQLATAELTSREDDRKANQDMHQQELQLSKDKMAEDRTARAEDRQFSRSMLTEKQQFEIGQTQKEFDLRKQLAEMEHQSRLAEIAARPDPTRLQFDPNTGMVIDLMGGKATPVAGYTPNPASEYTKWSPAMIEKGALAPALDQTILQGAGIQGPTGWDPAAAISAADPTRRPDLIARKELVWTLINDKKMRPDLAVTEVSKIPPGQAANYLQNMKTGGQQTAGGKPTLPEVQNESGATPPKYDPSKKQTSAVEDITYLLNLGK